MPITKKSILAILEDQQGLKVSSDAVDLLNGIVTKVLTPLLPKDGSVLVSQIEARADRLKLQNDYYKWIAEGQVSDNMNKNPPIPKETVKRIVRMHAGDVKVLDGTIDFVGDIICDIVHNLIMGVLNNPELQQSLKGNAISGKDIINHLFNTADGRSSGLHEVPIGPLTKSLKGKSRSKKRRSSSKNRRSSSKKSCSSGKLSVRGFLREGKRIKSYCRKK